MALVKYGGGVIQMAGSIAGNTYARNRYGNYVRARTKPTNPNYPGQQEVRAAVAWLVDHWSQTLTADQRTAWCDYAAKTTRLNRLGESMRLSGFNDFIRSNAIRKRAADTIIVAGPTIFEVPAHDPTFTFTCDEASQQITPTFDNTMGWANEADGHLYLFCGAPQNPQRNFFAGPWKYLGTVDGDAITPPTPGTPIDSPFALAEGQRVWIYARISRADGRLSEPFRAGPTLVAAGV